MFFAHPVLCYLPMVCHLSEPWVTACVLRECFPVRRRDGEWPLVSLIFCHKFFCSEQNWFYRFVWWRERYLKKKKLFFFPGLGQLSQSSVSMGGYSQSIGQLNQSSALSSGLNSGLPIATSMASNGSSLYQAHYGLNSLGEFKLQSSYEFFIFVLKFWHFFFFFVYLVELVSLIQISLIGIYRSLHIFKLESFFL